MKRLENDAHTDELRHALMQFLNEFALDAPAILSMARRAEPVRFESGEVILAQGERSEFVYFLISGHIEITIRNGERVTHLGDRTPVTVLGEISYFNRSPVTATVQVKERTGAADMLRLSYDEFSDVIGTYPGVEPALARIGEMRVIRQYNGYCGFRFFMDMIGWKHDRLAVNRAMFSHLEDAVLRALLPRLRPGDRLLDCGDGPGVICEIAYERDPDSLDQLFVQATYLEDAIIHPTRPYPSDLSRAQHLKERFQAIAALQVFNHIAPEEVGPHFALAAHLLEEDGLLMIVQLPVLDTHEQGHTETHVLFHELEDLVRRCWPDLLGEDGLVKIGFLDADFDPMMEWHPNVCESAARKELSIPSTVTGAERPMLEVLLTQASQSVFNPDEMHFHWLVWQGARHGFMLETHEQRPDVSFFYQLFRLHSARSRVRIFGH